MDEKVLEQSVLRHNLNAIWYFVQRDLKLWTYFRLNFLIELTDVCSHVLIYAMIARLGSPRLEQPGASYVSFVILGLALNTILTASISGPYSGLMDGFWNNRLEVLLMSPISLPAFAAGSSLGGFVRASIRVLVYLLTGLFFFGFQFDRQAAFGLALIYLLLGIVACTGLGLMAASMIYYIDARGGQDPIRLVAEILSGLVAGVYFPLQLLPASAQWLSLLIPHAFVVDGVRQALLGGGMSSATLPLHHMFSVNPHLINLLALSIYCVVSVPLGWRLFKGGMKLARSDGRLSRWV